MIFRDGVNEDFQTICNQAERGTILAKNCQNADVRVNWYANLDILSAMLHALFL